MQRFVLAITTLALSVPSHAQTLGDVNGDNTVDFNDLLSATIAFTGPAGVAFLPGDADGDLDVDDEDIMVIVSAQTAFQGPGPGFAYELAYDPSDGSLTIDTKGGTLNGYALKSGVFTSSNHSPFVLGTFASLGDVLSESNPFGGISGAFDLGAVLTPGLDEAGFAGSVTTANYTTGLGQPIASFDLVFVPEPTSAALFSLALAATFRRRRI
ncbi:MAG: PEP-CTERM sorting domain-containing protein [Planctomycetota bacterium]